MKSKLKFQTVIMLLMIFNLTGMLLILSIPERLSAADEMPLPPDLQAAMFQKIFLFDKTLPENKEEINILMVHGENAPEIMEKLKAEFEGLNLAVTTVKIDELSEKIEEAIVVYVLPGADPEAVKELSIEKSKLTISGVPAFAEEGHVSIALGLKGESPQIIVNIKQVKTEGHEFSAELLKLAKVIK